jgi:hypothetical protein
MTPKEKAQELFHKFWDCDDIKSFELAKQCALITVNEIKKSAPLKPLNPLGAYPYWQEVKKELEKL